VAGDPHLDTTFPCSVCGAEAGHIRLHVGDRGTEIRRESWPGVLILPVGGERLENLEAALGARDVPSLFALEPELTPFYCPTCGLSYCADHWDWWDVWDDEWIAWRDSVRGRCPQGHERMLED
jgi:hypothetical protein